VSADLKKTLIGAIHNLSFHVVALNHFNDRKDWLRKTDGMYVDIPVHRSPTWIWRVPTLMLISSLGLPLSDLFQGSRLIKLTLDFLFVASTLICSKYGSVFPWSARSNIHIEGTSRRASTRTSEFSQSLRTSLPQGCAMQSGNVKLR